MRQMRKKADGRMAGRRPGFPVAAPKTAAPLATALLVLGVLTIALLAAASCIFDLPERLPTAQFKSSEADAAKKARYAANQVSVAIDPANTSATATSRAGNNDVPYIPEENRQPVLSMGEKPGDLYITWKGSRKAPQYLRYSDDKYSLPAAESIKAQRAKILNGNYYRYKAELTGLEEGQLYYYEIGDGTVFDSPRFFYAPEDGGEAVFAYLGDPQFHTSLQDYEDWGGLVWEMYKTNNDVAFAITGGDMVNIPIGESHWSGFLDNCGLFSMIPLMTIPGNHEGVTSNATYKKLFHHINNGPNGEAFYYFDYGPCRFIMLDSSFLTKARQKTMGKALWSARAREVENWLRQTLAGSDKSWNIVVTHHPVYGMHDVFTASPQIRKRWLPIMEEEGADLTLCGHQHVYMRSAKIDGIVHIMGNSGGKRSNFYRGFNQPDYAAAVYAAGANYQVIRATKTKLELTSYDSSNVVVDSFQLKKTRWSEIF